MGELNRFLKKNKVKKDHIKIAATSTLVNEDGMPLEWEIRSLNTKEDMAIREACTTEVPITGKPGFYRPKFDSGKYLAKMAAACVVYPNLNDKELQDSYGVLGADQLIMEMIDDPGEYNNFMGKLQAYHGFNESMAEKVDEAKN